MRFVTFYGLKKYILTHIIGCHLPVQLLLIVLCVNISTCNTTFLNTLLIVFSLSMISYGITSCHDIYHYINISWQHYCVVTLSLREWRCCMRQRVHWDVGPYLIRSGFVKRDAECYWQQICGTRPHMLLVACAEH